MNKFAIIAFLAIGCAVEPNAEVEPTTWVEGSLILADGGQGQCVVLAEFNTLDSALEIRPEVTVNGSAAGYNYSVTVGPPRVYVMLSSPLRVEDSVTVRLVQGGAELIPARSKLLCE